VQAAQLTLDSADPRIERMVESVSDNRLRDRHDTRRLRHAQYAFGRDLHDAWHRRGTTGGNGIVDAQSVRVYSAGP
jgi:hypothetical protein